MNLSKDVVGSKSKNRSLSLPKIQIFGPTDLSFNRLYYEIVTSSKCHFIISRIFAKDSGWYFLRCSFNERLVFIFEPQNLQGISIFKCFDSMCLVTFRGKWLL